MYGLIQGIETPMYPFRAYASRNGVHKLPRNLTVNGVTKEPVFRYKLGDADATNLDPWLDGEVLSKIAGNPTYNNGSPGQGWADDSCLFDGTTYYTAAGAVFADITTEDIAAIVIVKTPPAGGTVENFVSKRNGANEGYQVQFHHTTNTLRFIIEDGTTATATVDTGTLLNETWYWGMCFINRSEGSANGAKWYISGIVSGAGDDLSGIATMTNATNLSIGASVTGGSPYKNNIAFLSLYIHDAWFQEGAAGPVEWALIATEQFALFQGSYPQLAAGTATPTVITRDDPAYLTKYDKSTGLFKEYYVGEEWIRQVNGYSNREIQGALIEPQITNLFGYSKDFTNWDLLDVGDTVLDDQASGPDWIANSVSSFEGDASDNQHGVSDDVTLTADPYSFSCWNKPGNNDWIKLENVTVANCYAYFNADTGGIGTVGGGCTAHVFPHPWVNSLYRFWITFDGTVAAHTFQILSCTADNDDTYSGGGGVDMYMYGAQIELHDFATSYVPTAAGATTTRLKDQLRFIAGANIGGEDIGQGTIVADFLFPDFDNQTTKRGISINDGGSANDRVESSITSNDRFTITSMATAGNNGTANVVSDVVDGNIKRCSILWETDNLTCIEGTTDGTVDATADMPDDVDRIEVGARYDGITQFAGILSDIRTIVYPTNVGFKLS